MAKKLKTIAPPPRRRSLRKMILQVGAVAGALTAIVTAWHLFDMPTPAWSSDIHKLNSNQATIAVEVYDAKLRRYLSTSPPTDPVARQIWDEDLRQARQQRDAAERRRIETSK